MSLHYISQKPRAASKNPPLIVLLHGLGSNERDLFSFAPYLDPRYLVVSVQAPLPYGHGGYAWFTIDFSKGVPQPNVEQVKEARQQFTQFLDEIIQKFQPNPNHVYLVGFSQGAMMSYATALATPEKITGLVAMSGYILNETTPQEAITTIHQQLKILATHGTNDAVLPIFLGRSAADYLQQQQFNYEFKEYAMGHEVNQSCFADVKQWLDQQVGDL
ncbi:alpha/beta hydrolase [Tunicatimonas pelagia]|uniref:alpha/beta hydrolase n=1 Tax=Tunicatimonas pelagia TaxID=931531 RepID=UPI002666C831|nr:alpha/beta fold hydrolase [Tunicatimonas pelagia]WKN43876.1 alpha/beta fold hydrolase [Tunicatimonas pelagia]